jgi:hypothetical protein
MSIAGHVSRAMLSRYSHVRMEAKRRALDEIATRQREADEKRKKERQIIEYWDPGGRAALQSRNGANGFTQMPREITAWCSLPVGLQPRQPYWAGPRPALGRGILIVNAPVSSTIMYPSGTLSSAGSGSAVLRSSRFRVLMLVTFCDELRE